MHLLTSMIASGTGSIPFSVSEFKFAEAPSHKGIQVLVAATAKNPYPININLPALDWVVEAPACHEQQIVPLAGAHSDSLLVTPHGDVSLKVVSTVAELPRPFTQACPGSDPALSAMDRYLRQYLSGEKITIYVRGKPSQQIVDFPPWVADLLSVVSIPVPVPGRKSGGGGGTDKMVKSFGLSRVKITLPQRGIPGNDALPRLSALVNAVIDLPKELDFSIAIGQLRGVSDMAYEGDKFGVLEIADWTPATSFYTAEGYIQVIAEISDVPLQITDQTVFKTIVQKMLFEGEVEVQIDGTIDVGLETPVGEFTVNKLPAKGNVALRRYASLFMGSGGVIGESVTEAVLRYSDEIVSAECEDEMAEMVELSEGFVRAAEEMIVPLLAERARARRAQMSMTEGPMSMLGDDPHTHDSVKLSEEETSYFEAAVELLAHGGRVVGG